LNENVCWPTKIKLSYCQASKMREILAENDVIVRPLFYYTRPGFSGPKLGPISNPAEQVVCVADPSAPREERPIRLYPMVS